MNTKYSKSVLALAAALFAAASGFGASPAKQGPGEERVLSLIHI